MKHIESILPEYAASEIDRMLVGDDDATATAALTVLLHNVTGCDIPQTDTLPESEVEELVPLCVSILRRHWQTPLTCLGDGTTPMSLSDLMRQLIDGRVNGNEALGIPPANANLPTALAALTKRHIDDGLTLTLTDGTDGSATGSTDGSTDGSTTMPLPDGLSLAQLLCDSDVADKVTEIKDSNTGWEMTKALTNLPNLEKILLGCSGIVRKYNTNDALYSFSKCKSLRAPLLKTISNTTDSDLPSYTPIFNGSPLEEVDFSELQSYTGRLFVGGSLPDELNLPKLNNAGTCIAQSCTGIKRIIAENVTTCNGYSYHPNLIAGCPDLEYAYIPNLSAYTVYGSGDGAGSLQDMPKLSHLVIGKVPFTSTSTYVRFALDNCPNLVLLDIRGDLNQNIYLDHWSPTTALAERLDEFLSNFQLYIADRVADRTGKTALTLTLSAAVYEALQAQEGQTILATLTNKNWTVAQA